MTMGVISKWCSVNVTLTPGTTREIAKMTFTCCKMLLKGSGCGRSQWFAKTGLLLIAILGTPDRKCMTKVLLKTGLKLNQQKRNIPVKQ